jgi:hypothetical protein
VNAGVSFGLISHINITPGKLNDYYSVVEYARELINKTDTISAEEKD